MPALAQDLFRTAAAAAAATTTTSSISSCCCCGGCSCGLLNSVVH